MTAVVYSFLAIDTAGAWAWRKGSWSVARWQRVCLCLSAAVPGVLHDMEYMHAAPLLYTVLQAGARHAGVKA
jgi:hypothetical protein